MLILNELNEKFASENFALIPNLISELVSFELTILGFCKTHVHAHLPTGSSCKGWGSFPGFWFIQEKF
jgi:hypothetical protein